MLGDSTYKAFNVSCTKKPIMREQRNECIAHKLPLIAAAAAASTRSRRNGAV
jgi:hypothetical protein